MPYIENIGVEILVLSSFVLISNIDLLIAEALTGEPNEKYPIFNKEPSHDNDEFETILIGDFCAFYETIVYFYRYQFMRYILT